MLLHDRNPYSAEVTRDIQIGYYGRPLDSRRAGVLASLDDVRDEAVRIWLTDESRKRAWEAVSRLKASYSVRYEQ